MKKIFILLTITFFFIGGGCVKNIENTNLPQEKLIGGDKDEHGCLGPAGYSWCPSTEKCQRMWEEYCEEYKDQYRSENNMDEATNCNSAGGNWNECGNKCALAAQDKEGIACTMQCEQLCECGGVAGFTCPAGHECIMEADGVVDALGFCKVVFENSNEKIITDLFVKKYNKNATQIKIKIEQQTEDHARGMVNFLQENGEPGEGGIFLAHKIAGEWQLVFDGNGMIDCNLLTDQNFPEDMMFDCYTPTEINNFDDCAAAGNPIMESYSRQCQYEDMIFIEKIDNPDEIKLQM